MLVAGGLAFGATVGLHPRGARLTLSGGGGASSATGSTNGSGSPSGGSGSSGSSPTARAGSAASSSQPLRHATGELVNYGYGVMSVTASVHGARLVDVSVAQLQTAEQYSQQLAQQVDPMLAEEAISQQSARIAAVSGATYTSEAYAMSLQSALNKLRHR
jgi:hypothetical protein